MMASGMNSPIPRGPRRLLTDPSKYDASFVSIIEARWADLRAKIRVKEKAKRDKRAAIRELADTLYSLGDGSALFNCARDDLRRELDAEFADNFSAQENAFALAIDARKKLLDRVNDRLKYLRQSEREGASYSCQ